MSERLTDKDVLVLLSLAAGVKHGYAVMRDIEEFARIRLGPGTLYTIIPKLEGLGLIEPQPSADRRTPYRLTGRGRSVVRAEAGTLKRITRIAQERLGAL